METIRVIGLVIVIALMLSAVVPDAGSGDPPPAVPLVPGSYLYVWVDAPEAETFDRVRINIRSHLISNDSSGWNDTPNPNVINVTLYAEDMDLIVYQEDVRLFLGDFTVFTTVIPSWTSARIQVIAQDRTTGLLNDTARFRTIMSQEYFLYLTAQREYEDDLRDRAILQGRVDLITIMGSLVIGSLLIALFVIFLRMDHRRSRRVRSPSLWDRLVNRVWPYSWTNDEAYAMLEDPETWAPGIASQYRDFKKEAHLRKLRAQAKEIRDEARAIQEGRIHV